MGARLSDPVAGLLYPTDAELSNPLANSFLRGYTITRITGNEEWNMGAFERYFTSVKEKKIAVLGLGVSNRPLVRLLLEFGC